MTTRTRTRRPPALPLWRVEIREHTVGDGRYRVPATTIKLGSPTAELARRFAVRHAHIDSSVPPFRSLLAESLRHATVLEISEEM